MSPIGRNCSREERNDYEKFDLEHNVRQTMVAAMQKEFSDLDMTYSIGGQISFDVFPTGWDKVRDMMICVVYLHCCVATVILPVLDGSFRCSSK